MSDRFLNLANKALHNEFVGQRLMLCRKAAEALCKNISPEPFPMKVGNNLSRMIDFRQKAPGLEGIYNCSGQRCKASEQPDGQASRAR